MNGEVVQEGNGSGLQVFVLPYSTVVYAASPVIMPALPRRLPMFYRADFDAFVTSILGCCVVMKEIGVRWRSDR